MTVSHMLAIEEVRTIAEQVAREQLPPETLNHAEAQPTTNSVGEAALRILYVLEPDAPGRIQGDNLLKLLLSLRNQLEARGEERAPIVQYATTDDLAEFGDDDVA